MKEIILASKSPRRKELLEKCGIDFTCDPADIDESMNLKNDLKEEIQLLARKKAEAVLKRHPGALVIGSDTIVVVDGKVFGKPKNHDEAAAMLKQLQGRSHEVITGLCFCSKKKIWTDQVTSKVTFVPMDEAEIEKYIASGECDDKAGAYGIQGLGGRYIEQIEGDYYAIMGLPLSLVYRELKNINSY